MNNFIPSTYRYTIWSIRLVTYYVLYVLSLWLSHLQLVTERIEVNFLLENFHSRFFPLACPRELEASGVGGPKGPLEDRPRRSL